jgi:hypothetical protein
MPATTGFYPEVKPKDSQTLSRAVQSALRGYCLQLIGLPLLPPFVQVDAAPSGLAGSVNRVRRFDALAFTANRERVETFVPALRSLFKVRSFRRTLEPFVEVDRHRS